MKHPLIVSMLITALLAPALLSAADDEAEKAKTAAQDSAKAWLALVDAGDYGASWEHAAALFRNAVTQAQWAAAAKGVRGPLGAVKERKLKSAEYATSLPGAPDGRYVVIQYDSVFERKAAAVETVTPMLDPDGKWRVSGYFVR